ncbi:MAG: hypothetical protein AB7P31_08740 [Steroidobacteraceae bacterium]
MPVDVGVPRFTRVVLADGPCCELARLDFVLERIGGALGNLPPAQRHDLARALLAMAVAYIGGHEPAAVSPGDSGP